MQTLASGFTHGSRAAGQGLDAVTEHISTLLSQSNYGPEKTAVSVTTYDVVGTPTLSLVFPGSTTVVVNCTYGRQFHVARFSGSGAVSLPAAILTDIDPCTPGAVPAGSGVAVIER